jgi:hypothetical protein
VSLYHRCAVGHFTPASLEIGAALVVAAPLDREVVSECMREHLTDHGTAERPALFWVDDAYVIVEYIAIGPKSDRVALVRAIAARTGCTVIDVSGRRASTTPWPLP